MSSAAPLDRASALERALAQPWYHTIDLGPGKATEGAVDLRPVAPKILPADLAGKRALDVGTFDGFWAFELERRGARVTAVDLPSFEDSDWPPPKQDELTQQVREEGGAPSERFRLAAAALESDVELVPCSIYDLDTDRLGGSFDYALVGALLLHLRDPVKGLERLRAVLEPGATLLLVEPIVFTLSALSHRPLASLRAARTPFDWWVPNVACLFAWLKVAGFAEIERRKVFRLKAVKPIRQWHAVISARAPAA